MKHFDDQLTQTQVDQFGQASAALLRQGSQNIPQNIKDRLYAARMKAISLKKLAPLMENLPPYPKKT
uniref:Uncharacterized protein n=1 Tax=Polynucleobacter necessarius subsp. necessarius (strain STIR1) TaxID=452638 RepID=B1XUI6_POLNS